MVLKTEGLFFEQKLLCPCEIILGFGLHKDNGGSYIWEGKVRRIFKVRLVLESCHVGDDKRPDGTYDIDEVSEFRSSSSYVFVHIPIMA